jgi:preprotein translocase SecE subunit
MATVKDTDERPMATDVVAPGADEPRDERPKGPPPARTAAEGGFFTIYKKGQGYWTRMGTAVAGALIIALTVHFLYQHLPVWFGPMFLPDVPESVPAAERAAQMAAGQSRLRLFTVGVCTVVGLGLALLVFWLMNKPANADFLIATDSEMKKVNWTSRKELIGSTKVVILFMFLIAAILFMIDIVFGYFFYLINVLHQRPF